MGLNEHISQKSLVQSRNQNIFEKRKLNRNLWRISFQMMYNICIVYLGYLISSQMNEGGGGGGGRHEPHPSLILYKCVAPYYKINLVICCRIVTIFQQANTRKCC